MSYEFQEYPKWLYHKTHGAVLFNNAKEVKEAGDGWTSSPADHLPKESEIKFEKPLDKMSKIELIKACRTLELSEEAFQGKEKNEIIELLKSS